MDDDPWLTYPEAARVARRHPRKIRQWIAEGMPASFDDQGRRIVRESVLLAEKRRRLLRNPAHLRRRAAILRDLLLEKKFEK